jgi:kynurenine 3-monooxygenase
MNLMKKKAIIIGAGMAGCFMAVCLAKRNYDVEVYESRPDVRRENYDSGRSFNLTLYYRGIEAMKKVGVWDAAKEVAEIAEGNVAHYETKNVYDSFDTRGNEILYTVHRNKLNGALINEAEKYDNINFFFNTKCRGLDAKKKEAYFEKSVATYHVDKQKVSQKLKGNKYGLAETAKVRMTLSNTLAVKADLIVGADGVNSTLRAQIANDKKEPAVKEYEDWGYKEVHINPSLVKHMKLRSKATHTWPRPDSLLIAFPNPDSSFTLMFNLQLEGEKSFAKLKTKDQIGSFIEKDFPDLAPLLPEIVDAFQKKKTGTFVTLMNPIWHDKNFAFLIGDAAHAFIPFYGQGMCAAFDDCLKFVELYDKHKGNLEKVFPLYQESRKRNTDLMAQLARENFVELRDKSRSPFFVLKDKADTLLHMIFPKFWQPPLYVLIAHGDLEYYDAYEKYQKQLRLSKKIGLDFALRAMAFPFNFVGKSRKN